jgi:hypothetical protein
VPGITSINPTGRSYFEQAIVQFDLAQQKLDDFEANPNPIPQ